ncbi:uncharacterized protein K452DRAFT_298911 [Aplosporella prunicola CBS 121167]|uniref:Uncharacterized protein n=1 Tax=Aplosporella prunicola CBS 121167 TaxID=1176127 RepID=A0A6A6BD50_9PEZI|nr:uncharacterized protein K452DRAFT_298911 [Aplosporella prunicola CBS 121167]KAF2140827.1 hypothetical protein K452DRAFT_298911 [Aplosporella prunicola CBS 121167]
MAPPAKASNLSARDLEVTALVWQCFKSDPSVDYEKLAQLANFKNAASASACWGTIKKKLLANSNKSVTASPAKKRTAKQANSDGDAGSPAKKPRGRKTAAALPPTPSSQPTDDDEDDDEEPTPLAGVAAGGNSRIKEEQHDEDGGVAVGVEVELEPTHTFFDTFNPYEDDSA